LQLAADLSIRARERPLTLAELSEADEIFLTNSAQEVVPVGTLDDRTLSNHTIAGRLLAAYRAEVAAG
jgi:branched-chain amino acid aminotransferase